MLERYVAKILPTRSSDFEPTWWGVLDCKKDAFVEHEVIDSYGCAVTMPLRFENSESARYEARIRNMTMTMKDV